MTVCSWEAGCAQQARWIHLLKCCNRYTARVCDEHRAETHRQIAWELLPSDGHVLSCGRCGKNMEVYDWSPMSLRAVLVHEFVGRQLNRLIRQPRSSPGELLLSGLLLFSLPAIGIAIVVHIISAVVRAVS